jgi:hypothetical protein
VFTRTTTEHTDASPLLASKYQAYAELLASQGHLSSALHYLKATLADGEALSANSARAILLDRISRVVEAQSAANQVGVITFALVNSQ